MNLRQVGLNLLKAFDALIDERGVTRAAQRLALTQPAVSGQTSSTVRPVTMTSLEQSLSVKPGT